MFRDRLVLTQDTWGTRNIELLFDGLFFLCLTALYIMSVIHNPSPYLLTGLSIVLPTVGYAFWLNHLGRYFYWIGLVSQVLFVLVVLPQDWLNPLVGFFSSLFSWGIVFFFRYKLHFNLPFFSFYLGFSWLFFLGIPGLAMENGIPFGWKESLPNWIPILSIFPSEIMGVWESLSFYGVGLISIAVFRRYSVFLVGLLFFLIACLHYGFENWETDLPQILISSCIFFFAYLLPGRNHYASLYVSVSVGCLFLVLEGLFHSLMGLEYPFAFVIILFFLVEGIVLHNFLVYRQREKT